MRLGARHDGQALLLLVAAMAAAVLGAVLLGGVAQGIGKGGREQRAADLGALAAARTMHDAYDRLFEPPTLDDGRANPRHLEVGAYERMGREAALGVARANGADDVEVKFPDGDTFAPTRIRVTVRDPATSDAGGHHHEAAIKASAEAELAPLAQVPTGIGDPGQYNGPFAYRQGKPMRPDVALAFDRWNAAARHGGIALIIVSAWRSNAEQARLFAAHPDPKWVAPPGKSLHRLGTELDLGPSSAYGWLAANAGRFGFIKRYPWEPWHFGYGRNPGSRSVGFGPGEHKSGMPDFVPPRFAPMIARASQHWGVGAALLAAQLYAESNFNPNAVSSAGAQGIAQFMPGTARTYGLRDPFDPGAAIDAQAHLMHDLLAQLGSVPLALAAYNAGAGRVKACMCVPPIPETQGYVARILGLLKGAGDQTGVMAGLEVRLVK
ncbi:MAG: transglycosylase SLT domain-containing protein [Solirubrobacteraceae bacterium]